MIRSNEIKLDVYAEARRQVDPVRREIKKVFLNVDIVITPTMKTPPGTITAALNPPAPPPPNPAATGNATRNAGGAGLNSVGAFDVYGLPCGIQTAPNSPYVYSVKGGFYPGCNSKTGMEYNHGEFAGLLVVFSNGISVAMIVNSNLTYKGSPDQCTYVDANLTNPVASVVDAFNSAVGK
jgi:hypothetical protein